MKATYEGFEAKQRGSSKMPPVGQYVAEIQGVRVDKPSKGIFIHNGKKVVVK